MAAPPPGGAAVATAGPPGTAPAGEGGQQQAALAPPASQAGGGETQAEAGAVAEISEEDGEALQQLYAIRNQAVTLAPGKWESSVEFSYVRDDDFLRTSWGLGAETSLRYGIAPGFEVGISLPYDYTYRRTETGTPGGRVVERSYIGDTNLNVSKSLFNETEKWPGVVINGGLTIPTGPDPYGPGAKKGKLPGDPFTFYRDAGGVYAVSAGAELFKTYDPFTFFGGMSLTYPFPRDIDDVEIVPGYTVSYNLGATLGISETTSIGFALIGSVDAMTTSGGVGIPGTDTMPLSTTFSVMQRLGKGFYVEPALTTGLTADAPDATFSITTSKTF
jgi:hypothetical protein